MALQGAADTLHLVEVPKGLSHGSEHDEKFLRKLYQVLLEVDVLEGTPAMPRVCISASHQLEIPQHAAD